MRAFLLALFLALSGTAIADANEAPPQQQEAPAEIPTAERDFVLSIDKFEKNTILEQLGEPSKRSDIQNPRTGEVVASIWHYHYINTADDSGDYYPTTELDFVGDKVVMVVFMNHDGEEISSEPITPEPDAPNDEMQELPQFTPEISI